MTSIKTMAVLAGALVAATSLQAQDLVSNLQDLNGARGRDGEYQMQQRGYTHVRTEKSDNTSYSFWTEDRSGRCVQVRTAEGRYASIVYAPSSDCAGDGDGEQTAPEREEKFETLCGSAVGGKITRYRCQAIELTLTDGKKITTLELPDMEMKLHWKSQGKVDVVREGLDTVHAKYNTSNGSHEIFVDGMTYFYVFDREEAERRLQKFNK